MSISATLNRRRTETNRAEAAAGALPVAAIDRGGALVRSDGTVVRILSVTPVNPQLPSTDESERLVAGVAGLVDGRGPTASLQLYLECGGRDGCTRTYVVVPTDVIGAAPARGVLSRAMAARAAHARREALRESLLETEAVRAQLDALGLRARLLDGPDVAAVVMRRLDRGTAPADDRRPVEVLGELDEREEADAAARAARDLRHRLGLLAPHFAARHVEVGRDLEQIVHLASAPRAAAFGWLARVLDGPAPCTLAVHVHGAEAPIGDPGARRGTRDEDRRRREPGGDRALPTLSVYQAIREPGPAASIARLAEAADAAAEALAAAADAGVHRGEFRQRELWLSTLPIADDVAAVAHPCAPTTVGRALSPVSNGCGSPGGLALGRAAGRVERLDPFDPLHATPAVLLSGAHAIAAGRLLIERLEEVGVRTAIAGRPRLPGAAALGVEARINPWDTAGGGAPDKVDFLVGLHELLLAGNTGFAPATRQALAVAIRAVCMRADREGRLPGERDLVRALEEARGDETQDALRALGRQLRALLGRREAAELLDRPTDLPGGANRVAVGDSDAGALEPAAPLIAAEHLRNRLTGPSGAGAALLVEAADRLAAHPVGAGWLACTAREGRRRGLLLIATTDRLAAFAQPPARAALAAFSLRLALREAGDSLTGVHAALGLGEGEAQLIAGLASRERDRALAHWINGARGRGVVELSLHDVAAA